MSAVGLDGVLRRLRRTSLVAEGSALTDAALLEAYLLERDEAAFEALLLRHGRMVLGVCQRVLGNLQDAEDAFQATFLVLVRKAHSITPRHRVGPWLHGVAYRTALKTRGLKFRRQQKEKAMPEPPELETFDPEPTHDLRRWLDRELSALPEIYRIPVVLCELCGQSKKEAAQQLGLPAGTVSSRLARGREMLRQRLARVGVPLSAAGLAIGLAEQASAANLPAALINATVAAITTGNLSTRVALLAQGVMGIMLGTPFKIMVGVLGCCLLTLGLWAQSTSSVPNRVHTPAVAQIQPQGQEKARPEEEVPDLNRLWSRGKAEGKGRVQLATFPIRLEDLGHISPLGLMVSGHVTPSDHLYVTPKKPANREQRFDVVAVAAGHLVLIQWRPTPPRQPDPTVFNRPVDLKLILEHSATCWSYLDHIPELDPAVQQQIGRELKPGAPLHLRIPIKAGQVLGKVGYQTVDFGLIDTTVTLKGFVRPEQFRQRDPWKPHTVDPFDYIAEPLKSKLLAFNPRQVQPLGGKIDHDVDGRLVGNWYREKTGGYAGLNRRLDYWVGHLTFAYHHVNPATIIVSIGAVEGRPRQFQVRGNGPDPAKIGKANGIVKYALITPQIDNRTGKPYPDIEERYYGTLLAQLLDNRQLRVELIPGKTPDEVKGFSDRALRYER